MTSISFPSTRNLASSTSQPAAFAGSFWRRHAYIFPSFFVAMLLCAWLVTWGDWNFFARENFCGFYDAQARSILHGHLDVPPNAIGFEAFIFRGKKYGYFGVGPAILHMPLVILFKNMDWKWSRSFMFAGFFLNLLCAYKLLYWAGGDERELTRADRILHSIFILCAGIGSTNIFLVSRSYTYHEAIMYGGVFALLFTVLLVRYFATPTLGRLALMGVCAFVSFHSRPTAGAGALLALCIVAAILVLRTILSRMKTPRARAASQCLETGDGRAADAASGSPLQSSNTLEAYRAASRGGMHPQFGTRFLGFAPVGNPLPHALVAIAAIVFIIGVYFAVNYGKFRTFDGVPVQYYSMYLQNPGRMKITGGRQFHIENIPTSFASYFGFRGAEFRHDFPWVFLNRRPSLLGSPALDVVEQYSSIPISMPAIGLLAVFGCMQLLRGETERQRQLRLPVLTLMLGGGIILATVGITERYLHDLYPFLIAAGAVGVVRIANGGASVRRRTSILVVLAAVSIVLNFTFAVEYQRIAVWGVSEQKRGEFARFRQSVQDLYHGGPIAKVEE